VVFPLMKRIKVLTSAYKTAEEARQYWISYIGYPPNKIISPKIDFENGTDLIY